MTPWCQPFSQHPHMGVLWPLPNGTTEVFHCALRAAFRRHKPQTECVSHFSAPPVARCGRPLVLVTTPLLLPFVPEVSAFCFSPVGLVLEFLDTCCCSFSLLYMPFFPPPSTPALCQQSFFVGRWRSARGPHTSTTLQILPPLFLCPPRPILVVALATPFSAFYACPPTPVTFLPPSSLRFSNFGLF